MLEAIIFTAIAIAIAYVCYHIKAVQSYWEQNGVKSVRPDFLLGNLTGAIFRKTSFSETIKASYDYIPEARYIGFYSMTQPILILRDPELIKQITVKDFDHFMDHKPFMPDGVDPIFSKNLFSLKGGQWKDMRATLSPAFTSSKMKLLFKLINENSIRFTQYFEKNIERTREVEVKDILSRFTNDIIATCAFGVQCDSLKDRENEFYVMGKEFTSFEGFSKMLAFFAFILVPKLSKALGISIITVKAGRFMKDIVINSIREREEKNIKRPDMINILMEAKKGRLQHEDHDVKENSFAAVSEAISKRIHTTAPITDTDIAAQASIFFFAGFETVSTCMTFMAYELAANPDIQKRLQSEIDDTMKKCNGDLTYEAIVNMEYMDKVLSETLRKWPPLVVMDRLCTKQYTIQPMNPEEKPVDLKANDMIWLPMYSIHRDPKYYPNPERFDPERFSEENKGNIIPYTYIPFGSGPRNCIGSRFALLETKTIFFYLLSKFSLELAEKTKLPIRPGRKTFNMQIDGGLWLNLSSRS